ncbi:hypothetical protein M0812_22566 [Anaeramoeba flamelloides]|uniref:BTB domain-containing protein n=1 Tax=Anaeramoeba flamelloides TaxID=1746091 RepID=A0AAV7YVR6_9EUKA|nr:hypothetical protein M0812_22566 [Anaeramoeba flamelloides]
MELYNYYFGEDDPSFLTDKSSNYPKPTPFIKFPYIVDMVISTQHKILFQLNSRELILFEETNTKKIQLVQNEKIKKVLVGGRNFMILSESGNVYSLGTENGRCQLPFADPENCSLEKLRLIPFFPDNDLFVIDFVLGMHSSYYLCKGGKLYGSGSNQRNQLSSTKCETQKTHTMPILLDENVKGIFSGPMSNCFFYTKHSKSKNENENDEENEQEKEKENYKENEKDQQEKKTEKEKKKKKEKRKEKKENIENKEIEIEKSDLKLYAIGRNFEGQLGLGHCEDLQQGKEVKLPFDCSNILDIQPSMFHSILLTKQGETYSTGKGIVNGQMQKCTTFKRIPQLMKKRVVQIGLGSIQSLALTEDNEIYFWTGVEYHPNLPFNKKCEPRIPQKINLPSIQPKHQIKITCGSRICFVYHKRKNPLINDFEQLLKNQFFSDKKIQNIKCHKFLIECRLKCKFKTIKKILSEYPLKIVQDFLDYIYTDFIHISNHETFQEVFKLLNMNFPPQNTLEQDLLDLYNDNKSKDFSIIVTEKKKRKQIERPVKVHKLILFARSGLFREMFQNIDPNINQIHDYSEKSKETIEILIKYLYTENIFFKNKKINKKFIKELENAHDYYQLNQFSLLPHLLKKGKK